VLIPAIAEFDMSDDPDGNPFARMALVSGSGLLISLIAILSGVRESWF
jgi:hypothetical protein